MFKRLQLKLQFCSTSQGSSSMIKTLTVLVLLYSLSQDVLLPDLLLFENSYEALREEAQRLNKLFPTEHFPKCRRAVRQRPHL